MDIGSEFDDDFFDKPRDKERSETSNYEPRVCVPLWYMESKLEEKENADVLSTLKHQADFYYFSGNFAKAAEIYEQCLELVPSSNNTWKREFMENLARSLLHLDSSEKALEWSLKLYESSVNADQKVVSMNLLAIVCHKLGKYKEELEALHFCIAAHKSSPEFWLRLGLCYAGLFKINLPGYSILKPNIDSELEPCCAFNLKIISCQIASIPEKAVPCSASVCSDESVRPSCSAVPSGSSTSLPKDNCSNSESKTDTVKCEMCTLGIQIVSSCFIHTRMLIDSGGPNVLGIERDERIKEKITSSLNHMEVDQSFIDLASKMLGSDFLAGLQETRDSSLDQTSNFTENLNTCVQQGDV